MISDVAGDYQQQERGRRRL